MTVVAIGLLAVAAAALLVRPRGLALWVGPVVCAAVGVVVTAVPTDAAGDALTSLRNPVLFLALAVPLAGALDALGVFEALAALVDGGRHLVWWLWVFGAAVTAVCNLDAAVVLLTPLYARIARRNALPLEPLVVQPAMLACLASHPLPVSNLTNLIVAERFDLGAGDFLVHLGPATVVSVVVGWWAMRRALPAPLPTASLDAAPDRRALVRGVPIIVFLLVGFTVGDSLGIPAWTVAGVALVAAVAVGAPLPRWRRLPWEAAAVALGLGVVVAGAAPHLALDRMLEGGGAVGRLRALLVGAVGSDLTNNLPTVLAVAPQLPHRDQVWPLLIGVNTGPALVLTGALSSLLWRETAADVGVQVSARRFAWIGWRVGVPALLAAGTWVVLVP